LPEVAVTTNSRRRRRLYREELTHSLPPARQKTDRDPIDWINAVQRLLTAAAAFLAAVTALVELLLKASGMS
jgi:hypothetical protein